MTDLRYHDREAYLATYTSIHRLQISDGSSNIRFIQWSGRCTISETGELLRKQVSGWSYQIRRLEFIALKSALCEKLHVYLHGSKFECSQLWLLSKWLRHSRTRDAIFAPSMDGPNRPILVPSGHHVWLSGTTATLLPILWKKALAARCVASGLILKHLTCRHTIRSWVKEDKGVWNNPCQVLVVF